MRLTLALLKRKMPAGNIWIGKHRIAHHIYPDNINRMAKRLMVEDHNLLLLRHPYINPEQERSVKPIQRSRQLWVQERKLEYHASRMRKSVRIEDRFEHLMHGSSWDPTS